jgi:integrase
MGNIDNEPIVPEFDFLPEPDVFNIWVSKKSRPSTRDGQPITVQYWEGCWDIPQAARSAEDTRKRPQITASSTISAADAEEKCRAKILSFWLDRSEGVRQETRKGKSDVLTREQRRAAYTVQSFLEEYAASKSNPNTSPENRWKANTESRARSMLRMWIYPYLGEVLLTELTHEQVRKHFQETLPNVQTKKGTRRLGDRRIRGIYSVFRGGMHRAGAKHLLPEGEYVDIGIRMTFEPAGVPEDIDDLMWEMNALLKREEVIKDPLALRWALAYGQGLRRGERCGLKWSDIDIQLGTMKIQRQLSYIPGQPEFLDEGLKAGDARKLEITPLTMKYLQEARNRRDQLEKSTTWNPREDFADLVLLKDDGSAEILNDDSVLFHDFMEKYSVQYHSLSPGALRHAFATFWANYGGPEGRGVTREMLRRFLGHSAKSNLDTYYARASQAAMSREFSQSNAPEPERYKSKPLTTN